MANIVSTLEFTAWPNGALFFIQLYSYCCNMVFGSSTTQTDWKK